MGHVERLGRDPDAAPLPTPPLPGLDRATVMLVVEVARAALGRELSPDDEANPRPPTPNFGGVDRDWSRFLSASMHHRVVSLTAPHGEALGLPPTVVQRLKTAAVSERVASLLMADEGAGICQVLTEASIGCLMFKGIALSVATTGSITGRGRSSDTDILIRPADLVAAHRALVAAGWQPDGSFHAESRSWVSWLISSRREWPYTRGSFSLDLHWRIEIPGSTLPSADRLLNQSESIGIGGTKLRVLARADLLMVACYTAYRDDYSSLRSMVDIVRILAHSEPPARPDSVRAQRLIAEASGFASELLGSVTQQRLDHVHALSGHELAWARQAWERNSLLASRVPGRSLTHSLAFISTNAHLNPWPTVLRQGVVDALFRPEMFHPGMGVVGAIRAVAGRIGDLAHLRAQGGRSEA